VSDLGTILEVREDETIRRHRIANRLTNVERRDEEKTHADEIPEGLSRLVRAVNRRYDEFVENPRQSGWYRGPVLVIDVSEIDFVSNVRHRIAVYEGIETLPVRKDFRA